jgi:hypothetical protein
MPYNVILMVHFKLVEWARVREEIGEILAKLARAKRDTTGLLA